MHGNRNETRKPPSPNPKKTEEFGLVLIRQLTVYTPLFCAVSRVTITLVSITEQKYSQEFFQRSAIYFHFLPAVYSQNHKTK